MNGGVKLDKTGKKEANKEREETYDNRFSKVRRGHELQQKNRAGEDSLVQESYQWD